jgi:DNA repair exonuclease SbcCD ATPase subunit
MAESAKSVFERLGDCMVNEEVQKKKKELAEGLKGMKNLEKMPSPAKKKPESMKPPEAGGEIPEKTEMGKPMKTKESEADVLRRQLEEERKKAKSLDKERGELEEKSRGLAEIIEKVSSRAEEAETPVTPPEPVEPKLKDLEKKMTDQFQAQLKELKDSMTDIGTKMEKSGKPEDGKVKKIVDKIQSETSSKISALEDTIKKLSDRLTPTEAPGKGGEDVSKGLAAMGGNVELQSDLEGVKRSVKDLERVFAEMRDENETRFSRFKEQLKRLEKLPSLEDKVQTLVEKLGPENIEKLKKLVFSTEELSSQVIPQEIKKTVSKEFSPVFTDVKDLKEGVTKLNERIKRVYNEMSYFKGELKTLYKFGDYISGLQSDRDKTREDLKEREGKLMEKISGLETNLKEKSEEISENLKGFKKDYSEFIQELVKKLFADMAESKLSEVKEKTSKELVSFRDEMDVVSSRFYQFENSVIPVMDTIKEKLNGFEKVLERVKSSQEKLDLNVEKSIEKKFTDISEPRLSEMEEEVSKKIDGVEGRMEDIGSELSQFRDVIKPTLEMFSGDIEKFDKRLEKFSEFQSNLNDKVKEIKLENKELFKTLGSLEKLEGNIETLDEKTKEIDDLRGLIDRRISELDGKLKTMDGRLSEQKIVLGRIDKIEKVLDDFSVEISKLSDGSAAMDKRIEDNKNIFEEGIDELRSDQSQFENVFKPTLDLFRNNLGELADNIQGFKEGQGKVKDELKDIGANEKDLFKRLDFIESYMQGISQLQKGFEHMEGSRKSFASKFEKVNERVKVLGERISYARKSMEGFDEKWRELKAVVSFQEKMEKRISRLEKELANTRAQFENVVEQSLMDRKKLEEMSKKQKERINSLLGELRG